MNKPKILCAPMALSWCIYTRCSRLLPTGGVNMCDVCVVNVCINIIVRRGAWWRRRSVWAEEEKLSCSSTCPVILHLPAQCPSGPICPWPTSRTSTLKCVSSGEPSGSSRRGSVKRWNFPARSVVMTVAHFCTLLHTSPVGSDVYIEVGDVI